MKKSKDLKDIASKLKTGRRGAANFRTKTRASDGGNGKLSYTSELARCDDKAVTRAAAELGAVQSRVLVTEPVPPGEVVMATPKADYDRLEAKSAQITFALAARRFQ